MSFKFDSNLLANELKAAKKARIELEEHIDHITRIARACAANGQCTTAVEEPYWNLIPDIEKHFVSEGFTVVINKGDFCGRKVAYIILRW